jgi:hypothetical protein
MTGTKELRDFDAVVEGYVWDDSLGTLLSNFFKKDSSSLFEKNSELMTQACSIGTLVSLVAKRIFI